MQTQVSRSYAEVYFRKHTCLILLPLNLPLQDEAPSINFLYLEESLELVRISIPSDYYQCSEARVVVSFRMWSQIYEL